MGKLIFFTVLMLAAQFGLSMRIRVPMTIIAVDEPDCSSPIDIANCEAASVDPFIKKWAYQPKRGYCQPFLKGACGGNNNAYETESMCLETCAHKRYFVTITESIASVTTVKFKAEEPEKTTTDELDETTTEEPDVTTTEELDETTTEEPDETTTKEPDETATEEPDETTIEESAETTTEEQKPISSEDMEIIVFNEGFMDIVSPSPIVPNNKETISTDKPTNKATDKATKKATNKKTKKATNKPTDKATHKTTNKTTNKATDKTTSKANDKTNSKATDKVTGFTEKGAIKSKRFRIATNKRTRTNADADMNFRAGADMSTEDKKPKNMAFDLPSFF